MRRIIGALVGAVLTISAAAAAIPNRDKYDKYFEVDLSENLPDYDTLLQDYRDKHTVYDRKYDWHWNIGNLFDAVFRATINDYGGTDKRVKAANEEALLSALEMIPPEYYQYIGPYLHTVPTISEKILNMPGIKETKNKFPTRIAPQLADVEDLEFLSPYLYFFLMPEVWSENMTPVEMPRPKQMNIKSVRNNKLYDLIKKIVPADEFYPDSVAQKGLDSSDLRTINITPNSPLSSGDIRAFVKTIPELNKIQGNVEVMAKVYGAGALIDMWESQKHTALPVNAFKDLIYPCRRLVQKMRVAGQEQYLKRIVAQEGFTPEEWAYTCDKTIRAYRMTTLSHSTALSLKAYALGVYNQQMRDILGDERAEMQFLNMQAALRMHEVPRHDVLEAFKNRKLLRDSFQQAEYNIIAAPIEISN